jgi:CRP-like cAMP-binding protein
MPNGPVDRMAKLDIFDGCSRRLLTAIDQLGATVDVKAGRVLCELGVLGIEFFVLLDGVADVRTASGARIRLRQGAWFGEVALLDDGYRRASVTAKTDATVLVFDRREFNALLRMAPSVRRRVELTTARIVSGIAPTSEPWYEPLPNDEHELADAGGLS